MQMPEPAQLCVCAWYQVCNGLEDKALFCAGFVIQLASAQLWADEFNVSS